MNDVLQVHRISCYPIYITNREISRSRHENQIDRKRDRWKEVDNKNRQHFR